MKKLWLIAILTIVSIAAQTQDAFPAEMVFKVEKVTMLDMDDTTHFMADTYGSIRISDNIALINTRSYEFSLAIDPYSLYIGDKDQEHIVWYFWEAMNTNSYTHVEFSYWQYSTGLEVIMITDDEITLSFIGKLVSWIE